MSQVIFSVLVVLDIFPLEVCTTTPVDALATNLLYHLKQLTGFPLCALTGVSPSRVRLRWLLQQLSS